MKKQTRLVTQAGLIAAMYVALTYLSSAFGLAYGSVQLRLSEVLTILPVFTPGAIPGLTLGCIIANIGSPLGIADVITGSLASLFAATLTYALRNIKYRNISFLSLLPPIVINALFVGAELALLGSEDASAQVFLTELLSVALSETAVIIPGGFLLMKIIPKTKVFSI